MSDSDAEEQSFPAETARGDSRNGRAESQLARDPAGRGQSHRAHRNELEMPVLHRQPCLFYKELSSIAGRSEGRVSLLVASTISGAEEVTTLVQEHGIQPARIVPLSFRSLHVSGTPTVYVLDGSGTIQWAHAGRMDDAMQKELVRFLEAVPPARKVVGGGSGL